MGNILIVDNQECARQLLTAELTMEGHVELRNQTSGNISLIKFDIADAP